MPSLIYQSRYTMKLQEIHSWDTLRKVEVAKELNYKPEVKQSDLL